jgi:hypothetical protein
MDQVFYQLFNLYTKIYPHYIQTYKYISNHGRVNITIIQLFGKVIC